MSLDGSLSGKKFKGQLVRPATKDFAIRNFPQLIVEIALGLFNDQSFSSLRISVSSIISGKRLYRIYDLNRREFNYLMLQTDFDRCKKIALMLGKLPLFSSDTKRDYLARAKGMVETEFSDRP